MVTKAQKLLSQCSETLTDGQVISAAGRELEVRPSCSAFFATYVRADMLASTDHLPSHQSFSRLTIALLPSELLLEAGTLLLRHRLMS